MSTDANADTAASVLTNEVNNCGILTLNRPKALNALNLETVRTILPIMQRWETSRSLVILKSDHPKAFCAGGDVRALTTEPSAYGQQFIRTEYTINHLIGTYRIPFVALIDGITMGGGVGLSVHGRYRVATERTVFAMPETLIGLFPDVGGSHFLPRLAGQLGMYLGLTGARLKGADVLGAGIATHYCPSERLADLQADLIVCRNDADVQRVLARVCDSAPPAFTLAPIREQIDRCFAGETVEEIVQQLERDGSEWTKGALKQLRSASPLSLKVSHRLLREGAGRTLAECLRTEFRLACRYVGTAGEGDFGEGVRALLIDKDNAPKWRYDALEQVDGRSVGGFFEPLGAGHPEELQL